MHLKASEIVLFKKDELGLLGPIKGKRLPVMVKYELLNTINSSRLTKIQACKVLGLNLKRFYFWQSLYTVFGLDGLIDRPPKPQNIVNHLLPEEKNHR